jgi:superfamily II DNA or RNA helicase
LTVKETALSTDYKPPGELFHFPAKTLEEQREERKATIQERCERVAEMVNHDQPVVVWCHLNREADTLVQMIPGAEQVKGSDQDDEKEARLVAFSRGNLRVLVTKPKIGAWGLNWQHCAHMTMFPSHSYEQYYQAIRRCWRYGQTKPVQVDIISSEGEAGVVQNMKRKEAMADRMFSSLVAEMNSAVKINRTTTATIQEEVPSWL